LELGFLRLPAEADRTGAQTQHPGQRQVGVGRLGERLDGLEAETDDLGGELELGLVSGVVGREGFAGGLLREGEVSAGCCQQEGGDVGDDGEGEGLGRLARSMGCVRLGFRGYRLFFRIYQDISLSIPAI
jgi:hypothetical protein